MFGKEAPFSFPQGESLEKPLRKEAGIPWQELLKELEDESDLAQGFIDAISSDPDAQGEKEDMEEVLRRIGITRKGFVGRFGVPRNQAPEDGVHSEPTAKQLVDQFDIAEKMMEAFESKEGKEKYNSVKTLAKQLHTDNLPDQGEADLYLERHRSGLSLFVNAIKDAERVSPELRAQKDLAERLESAYFALDYRILTRLMKGNHMEAALDVWEAAGMPLKERSSFVQAAKQLFVEESGILRGMAQENDMSDDIKVILALKGDPALRKRLAAHIEQRVSVKCPAFYAACVAQMPDVFGGPFGEEGLSIQYADLLRRISLYGSPSLTVETVRPVLESKAFYVKQFYQNAADQVGQEARQDLFSDCFASAKGAKLILSHDNGFFERELAQLNPDQARKCIRYYLDNWSTLVKNDSEFGHILERMRPVLDVGQEKALIDHAWEDARREEADATKDRAVTTYSVKKAIPRMSVACQLHVLDLMAAKDRQEFDLWVEGAFRYREIGGVSLAVAERLIELGYEKKVLSRLENVSPITEDFLKEVAAKGYAYDIADDHEAFPMEDLGKLAKAVFSQEETVGVLAGNRNRFQLDATSAQPLLERGLITPFTREDIQDLDMYCLNLVEVARVAVRTKAGADRLAGRLVWLEEGGYPREVALGLIEWGHGDVVANNITRFSGLDALITEQLIEHGCIGAVIAHIEHIDLLPGTNLSSLIMRAINMLGEAETVRIVMAAIGYRRLHSSWLPVELARASVNQGKLSFVFDHRNEFQMLDDELERRLDTYGLISQKIVGSPSRTVRRMGDTLIEQLSHTTDPVAAYDRIERVFLRNHIPLAGKVLLAFETIYGDAHFRRAYSPTLRESGTHTAKLLVYKDLINIHLDTGNPSLKTYLKELEAMLPLMNRIEAGQEDSLSDDDRARVTEYFRKVFVLREVSAYAKTHPRPTETRPDQPLGEQLNEWSRSLGARPGQTVESRLAEMFLMPAGVRSIPEALARMEQSARTADRINRALVQEGREVLGLREGDLLKGVQGEHLISFLQNGNVAKEYLGYAAGSDGTPLDTDVSKVLKGDLTEGNEGALKNSLVHNYGNIVLVMRPTQDRFFETAEQRSVDAHDQIRGKVAPYELFQSPVVHPEKHWGIRTGVPFTEVRWIIVKDAKRRELLDLKMDIVANGYYVALTDEAGKVLFSPDDFDELNKLYNGTEIRPGSSVEPLGPQDRQVEDMRQLIGAERPKLEHTKRVIEERVRQALTKVAIPLRVSGELAIGAEVMNTGSTARFTSIPGETVDFDLAVRLDENDLNRQKEIQTALDELLPGTAQGGGERQWRRTGIMIDGETVDIDITFTQKPEVEGVPSHRMAEERLRAFERFGPSEADSVRANIVLAKKTLKSGGVYKKLDGGLGGLGVENWILQSGGSFARAKAEFLAAAVDREGQIIPFETFVETYAIPDPGVNMIDNLDGSVDPGKTYYRHDNFTYFLQKQGVDGYQKMVRVLQATV